MSLTVDGEDVTPTAPKRRLLLALLVCRAGRPISVDRLIAALWGDKPPGAARGQLRWHIHHLRQNLHEQALLEWTAEGYVLRAGADELDVVEFEALCRGALSADDLGGSYDLATKAIGLWRDKPYAEFADDPELAAEAERLEELRLSVLEHRADAALKLGRHAVLVSELRDLVGEHPLRERFREQLMLALHHCGRSEEALDVFRQGHDLSVERLGLEPGERLSGLARRIRVSQTAPAELPAVPANFTGRQNEVDELVARIHRGDDRTIVLSGPGGVGKSALAIHIGHLVAADFPGGQLYVNLRGATPRAVPLDIVGVATRLLRSLHRPAASSDLDVLAESFHEAVRERGVLVVLDDALDAQLLEPLLPLPMGSQVLVTTRNPTGVPGAIRVRLDVLPSGEARELLTAMAGREVAAADLDTIIDLCGRLPLALAIVGARLRAHPHRPVSRLVDRLHDAGRRLSELTADDRAVRASFDVGYRAVADGPDGQAAARLFRLLGACPGHDVTVAVTAALADTTPEHARKLLEQLVAAQLVSTYRPGRFQLHDLLRLYARELAGDDEARDAVRRVTHCYLATVRRAYELNCDWPTRRAELTPADLLSPGIPLASREHSHTWLDEELDNLAEATRAASDDVAVSLAVLVAPSLRPRGLWRHQLSIGEIALAAAERHGETVGLFLVRHDLASVQRSLGLLDEAARRCEANFDWCRQHGEPGLESISLSLLGEVNRLRGEYGDAEHQLHAALDQSARHGEWLDESVVHMRLGLLYRDTGRGDAALAAQHRALDIARQTGDKWNEIAALGNIGDTFWRAGRAEEAAPFFEQSLRLLDEAGPAGSALEADQHWGCAETMHALGRTGEAREHWNTAAVILHDLGLISAAEKAAILAEPRPPIPPVLDV